MADEILDPQQEELLTRLNYAVFGVRGDNGLLGSMKALADDFHAYVAAQDVRREEDMRRQQAKDRTLALAAVSAVVACIGVISTLIVVLVTAT